MPKTRTDYSHTIIYKICCKDVSINDIYILVTQQILLIEKISIKHLVIILIIKNMINIYINLLEKMVVGITGL